MNVCDLIFYGICFFGPLGVLARCWIKNQKKFTFNTPGFESIEGKTGKERISAIEAFYANRKGIDDLIANGNLFARKSYLIWYTSESDNTREIKSLIFSALLGGLATAFFSLQLFGKDMITTNGCENYILIGVFLLLLSGILCFLLYTFIGEPRDGEDYIYSYELSFIEEALNNRVQSETKCGKTLLVKDDSDRTYLLTL